jgi:hypothetical protein
MPKKSAEFARNSAGIRLLPFVELALMELYAWGVPNAKEMNMTIEFQATEFETAHEAIPWTEADGRGVAVLLDGKNLVVDGAEADRLAAAGIEFAYLCDHEMPDGAHRIVTVPVN